PQRRIPKWHRLGFPGCTFHRSPYRSHWWSLFHRRSPPTRVPLPNQSPFPLWSAEPPQRPPLPPVHLSGPWGQRPTGPTARRPTFARLLGFSEHMALLINSLSSTLV